MGADQRTDWQAAAASALDWWVEAGVDTLVDELPRDWLQAPVPVAPAMPAAASTTVAEMPGELAAFLEWRAGPRVPETDWRGVSVAAAGPLDAAIMVLVDCPERDDGEAGRLMTGAVGALFDRMLAAIGLSRETVHLAAVCAKRPVAGRMPGEVAARLAAISQHHVALVGPRRLLVMGNAASRAVLGADLLETRGKLHPLGGKEGATEVVATFHPRFLLEKPAAKAEAWRDLQLLTRGLPA